MVIHNVGQGQGEGGVHVVHVPARLALRAEALAQQRLQHVRLLHRLVDGADLPCRAAHLTRRHGHQPLQDADWTEGHGYRSVWSAM